MRFRKKPVVVEAYYFQNKIGPDNRPDWILDAVANDTICFHRVASGSGYLTIITLEGVMRAYVGDWIIKGVKGEIYPCKPDIFVETYETIESD